MAEEKRILVIEDERVLCEVYARALRQKGFVVDTAYDLTDGLRRLSERTYHVAMVDLGLTSPKDIENADGLAILKALQDQSEGTVPIVVSKTFNTQLAADTLQRYGAMWFVAKAMLSREGLPKLTEEVTEALAHCQLRRYGERDDVLSFLAGKADIEIWIGHCLERLKPAGGYRGLKRFMEGFLDDLGPLLPLKNSDEYLPLVGDAPLLHGHLWSKANARALEFFVTRESKDCKTLAEAAGITWESERKLKEYMKARLIGYFFSDPFHQRNDFV